MKNKHNLFAVVERNSNRAVALIESGMVIFVKNSLIIFDILPVSNTGVTSHRSDKGTITSMSIWIDSNDEPVYYIITDWPDTISIGEAYEIIAD